MQFEWSDESSDTQSIYTIRPASSPKRETSKLTYGIELEFNVPYIVKGQRDPHPDTQQPVVEITQEENMTNMGPSKAVMREIRRQIELVYGEQGHQASDVMVLGYPASRDPEYKKWDLKQDFSVNERAFIGEDGYAGYVAVEIASRVFTSYSAYDTWNSEYIIGKIARFIRWEHRIRINSTCGFHVHVGLENQLPEHLFALKKLGTILWLAEDLLEPLYHPARREGSNTNEFCRSLKHSTLGDGFIPNRDQPEDQFYETYLKEIFSKDQDLAMKMSALWKAYSSDALVQMLWPAPGMLERLAYNFCSLGEARGTIEFRSMESSFSEDLLNHWPRVCKQILRYAKRNPDGQRLGKNESQHFQEMIKKLVDRPNGLDTWKFLEMIYCEEDTIKFFQDKQKWDAESWQALQKWGDLEETIFPYRPQAPFFQAQRNTEYGRNN